MADEKRLVQHQAALPSGQLEIAGKRSKCAVEVRDGDVEAKAHVREVRLAHNEQETNLRAADAKVIANKQGARAQLTEVDIKAKDNKTEIGLTKVNITKDPNKDNGKTIVTAAKVTKDAEGKTRGAAITTEGAGTTFDIPLKGNKEFAGVRVTHEATGIIEDETGEQKLFYVLKVSPYNSKIQAEKCEAIKKAIELSSQIPRHIKLRVCWKLSLLIFYTFLFLYPLITFLVERQYVLYNLVCIGISAIGFGLQIFEFDRLYIDLKNIWSTCKLPSCGCCKTGNSDSEETCKCKKVLCSLCSCCPGVVSELISIILNEILLYATLICTLMGVISERTWELQNALNYFDCLLLVYSIIMEVLVPRLYYIRWINGAINTLLTEYFSARNMKKYVWSCNGMCTRCVTPLRFTPMFVILVILLQFFMLGLISVRIYADNYLAQTNITRNGTEYITEEMIPEEGTYHVRRYTWYTIIGGIVVPLLSVATYFIINQYWVWQPLHYTGQHRSKFVPKNTMIGSMTDADKWIIFAFDPIAWVAMVLLLASFIAFCVFAAGNDYDGDFYGGIPNWVSAIHLISFIFMCFSFMGANIQTVGFGFFIYLQPCCLCVVLLQMVSKPRYRVH